IVSQFGNWFQPLLGKQPYNKKNIEEWIMALGVTYMPLFLPPVKGAAGTSGTEAPAPVPVQSS
ncbi:hypothetical protein E4U49_003966, partial [Claviceps purpurea]